MYHGDRQSAAAANLLILAAIIVAWLLYSRRRSLSTTACGTASWASDTLLKAWGMLGPRGLILGRTQGGDLIRLPRYCHVLLVGSPGSGKGVGIILPNLFDYTCGPMVVFDTKGDLFETAARRRRGRVFRLAPFNGGCDRWNVLDTIEDGPLLIDHAKALAESLVVRPASGSREPHFDDKAAQIVCGLLVLVLRRMTGAERSLNCVQDIASDPQMLFGAADALQKMGGIPARFGSQIKALFEKDRLFTREGGSVISTVARHLSFLDSELALASLAESTFCVRDLLETGGTLFLQIPPALLEAQRGLLRCWVSTLIREIGTSGAEERSEVLFLLDEASALGGLAAVEEALVRGRSAGCRLLLAYQSDAQVSAAFKDKPSLLYDTCATHIYLGASSYETAERISKSLGSWTQTVESQGENSSRSRSGGQGGEQTSHGQSVNYAVQGRPLMFPDEVLRMSDDFLIAFLRGFPAPILARRIRWFEDPAFNPSVKRLRRGANSNWIWVAACAVLYGSLLVWAKISRTGYWSPAPPADSRREPMRVEPKSNLKSKGAATWPKSAKGH